MMQNKATPTRSDMPAALAVHAIVPMKDLARAKSRLAVCLSPPERRALAEALLQHVLATLGLLVQAGHLRAVWVVSSDAAVLQATAAAGARPLPDSTADLNAALHLAQASTEQAGAEALLIIPADVPLLTAADVLALVDALQSEHSSAANSQAAGVIVPSRDGSGTNALGVTLPTPLPFQFGSSSFARHQESARRLGMHLRVHTSPTLALDIDTPEDLAQLEHEQQHRERTERDGNHWICCGT